MTGYHLSEIPKGRLGDSSKIMEELLEVQDAENQGCDIMVLVELSDLFGAVICYLEKHYPNFSIEDLAKMNDITARAFRSGERK